MKKPLQYIVIFLFVVSFFSILWCTKSTWRKASDTIPLITWYQTIIVLGDSLSAWYQLALEDSYPILLEQKLLSLGYKSKVINAGKSGDTSAGLKERIEWISADVKTGDIALVVIGGNDGLQWLDTERLKDNLKDIVTSLQGRGIIVVIGGMQIPTNLGEKYRSDFAAVYPTIARETQSQIIPFILTGVAGDRSLNLPDGIHPNETGQVIVANTVLEFLIKSELLQK